MKNIYSQSTPALQVLTLPLPALTMALLVLI